MFDEHYFNKLYLCGIYFDNNWHTKTLIHELGIHISNTDPAYAVFIISSYSYVNKKLTLRPYYEALRVYIPTEHVETLLTYILLNSEAVFHFIEEVGVKR